ncbi:unnamed protein product [Pleuronectes platessa]|uniref:Uncharacterized protein n=1 Tax=Pleuronectes platessa TaxID=8262 RepID=A0A9N7YS92_PLEPL|nr:unnamed protein product [Pleuronectes platessa]
MERYCPQLTEELDYYGVFTTEEYVEEAAPSDAAVRDHTNEGQCLSNCQVYVKKCRTTHSQSVDPLLGPLESLPNSVSQDASCPFVPDNFTQRSKAASLFSCIAEGEAWLLQLKSSLRIQLYERSAKVQLPAHLIKETSSQIKLYQTPSSDLMSCKRTSTSN